MIDEDDFEPVAGSLVGWVRAVRHAPSWAWSMEFFAKTDAALNGMVEASLYRGNHVEIDGVIE
jgi:hypothetical protein